MMFLQNLTLSDSELVSVLSLLGAFAVVILFLLIGIYIYSSFAYSAIGRKAKVKSPGIAWIPVIGPLIIIYKASRMHWWPWLLIIGFFIPVINIITNIAFTIIMVIWHWKTFEAIKRPGWWAILNLIPIVNFIIIGIAAWGNQKK